MPQACGNCNYKGDSNLDKGILCLIYQEWGNKTSCSHYQPYSSNISNRDRITLATEKKRQIDEENRQNEQMKKKLEEDKRRRQERSEDKKFKLKTLILSNIFSIIAGFILAYLLWAWKLK